MILYSPVVKNTAFTIVLYLTAAAAIAQTHTRGGGRGLRAVDTSVNVLL